MDTNIENNNDEVKTDNNNPLSVRVDTQYKEMFNNIIKENGISKKQLMENMITSYAKDDVQQSREEHISFSNEINLISSNLDEIFRIFNSIAVKSQDTIGSTKSFYEQNLKNMDVKFDAVNNNLSELQERNNILEIDKNGHSLEKEKLLNTIEALKQKDASKEIEISTLNKRNLELLEQINSLRSTEKENHVLSLKTEKLSQEIDRLKNTLLDKDYESDSLNKKLARMSESLNEIKSKQIEELKELELKFKQEAEIDKKTELLKIQSQYNDLQTENIKYLGILNQKAEEIFLLKSGIGVDNCK